MKYNAFLSVVALFAATTVASATVYDCAVQPAGDDLGWMPQRIVIDARDRDNVMVTDDLSLYFNDGPVPGDVLRENDKVIAFTWTVAATRDSAGQQARIQLNGIITKANNSMRMTVKPLGYSNSFRGRGICSPA